MTKELREMSYDQLIDYSAQVFKEVRRRAYGEGYKQGKSEAVEVRPEIGDKLKQAERDRIVEQAKADIESLKGRCRGMRYGSIDDLYHISDGSYSGSYALRAKFVINKHKRTVVVLMYGAFSNKVRSRGIAKCAPDDCFNVHIGKAIALRRALGLEIPSEYLTVPNPTEVRVGDVMKVSVDDGTVEVKPVISTEGYGRLNVHLPGRSIQFPADYAEIIDDSREE